MSSPEQRQVLMNWVQQACDAGARRHRACAVIGLTDRTLQRWMNPLQVGDRRTTDKRVYSRPPNQLSDAEREAALSVLNSHEYKDLPPSQVVPRLADQGLYVASESTMYRLLHQAGQMSHRRLERAPQKRSKPRALVATRPDQIYSWDITYLPTSVRGTYFYLYLFLDVFSRKGRGLAGVRLRERRAGWAAA